MSTGCSGLNEEIKVASDSADFDGWNILSALSDLKQSPNGIEMSGVLAPASIELVVNIGDQRSNDTSAGIELCARVELGHLLRDERKHADEPWLGFSRDGDRQHHTRGDRSQRLLEKRPDLGDHCFIELRGRNVPNLRR